MKKPFSTFIRYIALQFVCGTLLVGLVYGDWPFVRGDALASGSSTNKFPDEPDVLWEFTAENSGFEATAVIQQGIIYVGDVDGTFYAIDLMTGQKKWKKTFEDSGFLNAAAIVDDLVYVTDFDGVLRCLKSDSGELVWEFPTESEVYAAPNVHAGSVLLVTESGSLLSIDAASGQEQWKFEIEAPLRCWPTIVAGRVFLAGCDEQLHAIDFQTGEEVAGLPINGPTGVTPAVYNGMMFFGTEQGTLYAVSAKQMETLWTSTNSKRVQPIRVAAAVDKRVVVSGSLGKQVLGLDPATGDLLWEFSIRSRMESSPVIVGDVVFMSTVRGRIYTVNASNGEEVWQFQAGGSFLASPAVSHERVVLGNTDGTLYCFGEKVPHAETDEKTE